MIELTDTKKDIYTQMKLAILRNFWMAIYENMLTVTIGEETICNSNLLKIIEDSFIDEDDSAKTKAEYNPLPYLRMIINADNGKKDHYKFELTSVDVAPDSKAIFYLHKKKTAKNRVLLMRSPRMWVNSLDKKDKRGYYGTFICTGGTGDAMLRAAENPAHNEWDKHNYDKDPEKAQQVGIYIDTIYNFIREKIDELFAQKDSRNDTIKDLDQYLYIPTEADEDEDDFTQESVRSKPIGELKDEGTSITTDTNAIVIPTQDVVEPKGIVLQPITRPSTPKPEGNSISGHGNSHGGKKGGQHGNRHLSVVESESDSNILEKTTLQFIPVTYRSFAQYENGALIHNVIIHSQHYIKDGRIDFQVGTEETDEDLNIIWSDQGIARDNTVTNLSLQQGTNKIKIRFADNMKHAIKIKSYEIK